MSDANPSNPAATGPETLAKTASSAYDAALEVIAAVEPRVAQATRQELADQRASLKLIASENYASPAVLLTMGTRFSDKYAEGTIGHRFYAGCQNVDTVESLAAEHAKELFGAPPPPTPPPTRGARQGAVRRAARLRPAALGHRRQPGRLLGGARPPGGGSGAGREGRQAR